jgi:HTH-type transcriptional regulator / antitoxin HigA
LLEREDSLTPAEKELLELLTVLIENFEERSYQLPRASPVAALEFLMDQQNLKQEDLVDVFWTASIASEVLNSRRELNKQEIRRLCERFRVSPELFF